ncbi:hypothetical protein [Streptomyces tauricus]
MTTKARIGTRKKAIRTNQVIALIDRWRWVATMSLPPPMRDQESAAYVEADVEGGLVRPGHDDAVEGFVRAVVDDFHAARFEEEGEVDAGEDEDEEAVEADLAEHEGPVVREHLAHLGLGEGVDA